MEWPLNEMPWMSGCGLMLFLIDGQWASGRWLSGVGRTTVGERLWPSAQWAYEHGGLAVG
eukprot:11175808-Lingulodinium_polyedra.AAC.1